MIFYVNLLDFIIRLFVCRYFQLFKYNLNEGIAFGIKHLNINSILVLNTLLCFYNPELLFICWPNLLERFIYGNIVDYIPLLYNIKCNINDVVIFYFSLYRLSLI